MELYEAVNNNCGLSRYLETFQEVRKIKKKYDPDIYILGFRGHEFYWALRYLVGEKPIIFDALMSPYAALRIEKKLGPLGSLAALGLRPLEKKILRNANLVLTDTAAHARYYQREFGVPQSRILALPVGAEESTMNCLPDQQLLQNDSGELRVLFFGSFLPLHGVDIIIEAARRIRDLPVHFDFIGGNSRQRRELLSQCASLGITRFTYRPWVEFGKLVDQVIPTADVCLGGPFGNTAQARRVITGKTSQCLALGKATIIGESEDNSGFLDKQNCLLVPQGDPIALAEALIWANKHRDQLANIGEQGRKIYAERLSIKVIGEHLGRAIFSLATEK